MVLPVRNADSTYECENQDINTIAARCNHVESATAGTLFHRVRLVLRKASSYCFEMVNSSKGMSSIQIAFIWNWSTNCMDIHA